MGGLGFDLKNHKSPKIKKLFEYIGELTISTPGDIIAYLGKRGLVPGDIIGIAYLGKRAGVRELQECYGTV